MNFKQFYEWYHRSRKLPKRIVDPNNFTYRIIISVLDKFCKSDDILDVGSGVGTLDFYLASKGKKITGIEISNKAVKVANKSLKLFGLEKNVKFYCIDFYKFKTNKSFSFVICSEVLEHLADDMSALTKINKLTKKDGLLLLTVPSKNAPLVKFGVIENFDKRSGHLRRYTLKELKRLFKKTNFIVIFSKRSEGLLRNSLFVFKWGNPIIRIANRFRIISDTITFLDDGFLSLFGESQLIVVAKKSKY
jgi:2-polyprenyl-3-methyl-5-hydroxy-6-metoxy-1,4-benzoquinol methylase